MLSFWEKNSFLSYDFIVVGAGIVGLSTAISLAEKNPKARILVLERGILPTGASTKNAGFACFGSLTELLADTQNMSQNQALALVERRWKGLLQLQKRLGKKNIDFRNYGGYELIMPQQEYALKHLDEINHWLRSIFNKNVFEIKNESIKKFGFRGVSQMLFNAFEGQIDTGKMMQALWQYAAQKGIFLLTNAQVRAFEDEGNYVNIILGEINFRTKKLVLATNAFTPQLLENLDIQAGRGQVLMTSPIDKLKFKGTFHFDEGFYYFRNYGNRVIFGGGRNKDCLTETTTQIALNENIMQDLEEKLHDIILPQNNFEITDRWAGIMAFGKDKQPILRFESSNVLLAVRMGGMGVAIGSEIGEKAAQMLIKKT